ncbi:MAG: hypothetical protein ACRDTA_24655, partial [Pseudonocardiaceae bacterium]
GRAVKLNGVAVVLAVAVGSVVAGIAGAVLAVPLLAMLNAGIRVLVSTSVHSDNGSNDGEAAGSDFPPADLPADSQPLALQPPASRPSHLQPPDPLVAESPASRAPDHRGEARRPRCGPGPHDP